jgi:hypothetical protein
MDVDKHVSDEPVPAGIRKAKLLTWSTSNSTLGDPNPSTNYRVLAQNLSVHGDGANRGQPEVFPVI